ncbi:DUF6959 family protein [Isoptericola sp. NPDC055881]
MERVEVELFSDPGNDAVVRMPGRRFPGVLIQGDSPHELRENVQASLELVTGRRISDARDELQALVAQLDKSLDRYEAALAAHRLPLPFRRT